MAQLSTSSKHCSVVVGSVVVSVVVSVVGFAIVLYGVVSIVIILSLITCPLVVWLKTVSRHLLMPAPPNTSDEYTTLKPIPGYH